MNNLLVIGDYDYGNKEAQEDLVHYLNKIDEDDPIQSLVTFDSAGLCHRAACWAFDNKIEYEIYKATESKYPLNSAPYPDNQWLRRIVDDYNIDSFFFCFLDHDFDKSIHKQRIRHLYGRAKKAFKRQMLYTNKEI